MSLQIENKKPLIDKKEFHKSCKIIFRALMEMSRWYSFATVFIHVDKNKVL